MATIYTKRLQHLGALVLSVFCLAGCARDPNVITDPRDPYERFNRKVFKFNMALDKALFRPAAKVYQAVIPPPLAAGVHNAFENLGEVNVIANDILQGNFYYTMNDCWRLAINTILGIFGLFDVASHIGLAKHTQDFGITLAHWGIGRDAPYLMLPIFGPSTIRDAIARPIDFNYLSAWPHIKPRRLRYQLYIFKSLGDRTALLPTDQLISRSFDPYLFVRNAYLQRRKHLLELTEHAHHQLGRLQQTSVVINAEHAQAEQNS